MSIFNQYFLLIFTSCLLISCNRKIEQTEQKITVCVDNERYHSYKIIEKWEGEVIDTIGEERSNLLLNQSDLASIFYSEIILKFNRTETMRNYKKLFRAVNKHIGFNLRNPFDGNTQKSKNKREMEFSRDTFQIKESYRKMIEFDGEGVGELRAFVYKKSAGEYLVYKYYMKLIHSLSNENKDLLKSNQQQWEITNKLNRELENELESSDYKSQESYAFDVSLMQRAEFLFNLYNTNEFLREINGEELVE